MFTATLKLDLWGFHERCLTFLMPTLVLQWKFQPLSTLLCFLLGTLHPFTAAWAICSSKKYSL